MPDRRETILLYFQRYKRLGKPSAIPFEYSIPFWTRKIIGFLSFKPKNTEPLIMALIFNSFRRDKIKRKQLYKALNKLWVEYLNTQYGNDLIKDATTIIDYLRKEKKRVARKEERIRKKTDSLQKPLGDGDFTLEDTVGGNVNFFEPINKDMAKNRYVDFWIDKFCLQKLKQVAKLRYIDDLELNTIAKIVKKSESYVDKQIAEIKKSLKMFVKKQKNGKYIAELLDL